ncbi:MAG: UDP-N-acetylmuramate dehydrogenase [Oscillospiraceae bacterium]|nr:UDP-N-acetylmuramate dehydrogenase [Oscillospiraceae bacterium]
MTNISALQQYFVDNFPKEIVKIQEPMSKHTSFRIGAEAEVMVFPQNAATLSEILKQSAILDCKVHILGAGTNVLAPDEGLPGLVICLKDCLVGKRHLDDTRIEVMAGETMTKAAVYAAGLGLSGMEFAHGIPGTVGGGVFMNAGAYGGEVCQILECVDVMDRKGNLRTMTADEMQFSYRRSVLEDTGDIVISAVFKLAKKDSEEIRATMKELMAKRSASQPLDLPSAGSAFKRPVGGYAAALIDQAGLKGFQIGGAAISTKHAGFAVNLGGATAGDVRNLLSAVSDRVYEKFAIRLEPEVRIW